MKRYSKAFGSVLGLAVLPLLLSCDDPVGLEERPTDPIGAPAKPMTMVIQPAAAEIEVGQTIRLRVVLLAADGQAIDHDFPVRWSTSRPERVLITDEGYATGMAPGNSQIMAESEFGSDWAYLTVRKEAPGGGYPDDGEKEEIADEEGGVDPDRK